MTGTPAETMLIDGRWETRPASRPVTDPSDGSVVGHVAWGGVEEARQAADAAARALPDWAGRPARARADLLLEAARLLTERREEIGLLLARETGKRVPEAVAELGLSAEYFRWFAEEVRRPAGDQLTAEVPGRHQLTTRRPVGVVASLTPWNFPCSIQARKLAPALAAGCTVVARVSEKAPLAVTELIRCLTDAGLPAGVINLVHGPAREVTAALLEHRAVRAVTFTGSTEVGRQIMAAAATRVVRPLLELGGDGAFIVFEDADLDAAVEGAMLAKFRNNGQSCVAANRLFVHEAVYEEFTRRLTERVDALRLGSPTAAEEPDLGPLIDEPRVSAVREAVEDALARGARLLTAERELPDTGSFCAPALLADVPEDALLATQEIFGPAAGIFRFTDEEEVLSRANRTEMGLAGYAYTQDAARCWRVARGLDVGILGLNDPLPAAAYAPMGGVKQSGLGREGAALGLEEFQEVTYVAWREVSSAVS